MSDVRLTPAQQNKARFVWASRVHCSYCGQILNPSSELSKPKGVRETTRHVECSILFAMEKRGKSWEAS